MNELEPRLRPLYRDLKAVKIGQYLISSDFDIYMTENNKEDILNSAMKIYRKNKPGLSLGPNDMEEVLRILMNETYKKKSQYLHNPYYEFSYTMLFILRGFIEWNTQQLDFAPIREDLELAGVRYSFIDELRKLSSDKNMLINSNLENSTKNNPEDKVALKKIETNKLIETSKKLWENLVANGEAGRAIKEIKDYADKTNNIELKKKITHISSQWNRVKNYYHKGTVRENEKELAINIINDALIDLIFELGS